MATVEKENGRGRIISNNGIQSTKYVSRNPPSRVINDAYPWPDKTTLIIGDSILNNIEESKLSKYKAKVRANPGSRVDDMYDYMAPLLKKIPSSIILHIGSNDSTSKSAYEIYDEILKLKKYIEDVLPDVTVYLSCPVIRADNITANHTLRKLETLLKTHENVVIHENIDGTCLGFKGLHLNAKGTGRLAQNFIKVMKKTTQYV